MSADRRLIETNAAPGSRELRKAHHGQIWNTDADLPVVVGIQNRVRVP